MTVLVECSSPGKVIVGGEHAVVYGYPSIVSAIDLRMDASIQIHPAQDFSINLHDVGISIQDGSLDGLLTFTSSKFPLVNFILGALREHHHKAFPSTGFSIQATSSIPVGAGMGSSAATCALFLSMLSRWYGLELHGQAFLDLACQAERLYHENPSGIDTTATIQGGAFLFERGKIIDNIDEVVIHDGNILVANTNVPRSTSNLVRGVKTWHDGEPSKAKMVFETIGRIVLDTWRSLKAGAMDVKAIGRLFNENQDALREMGVSIPLIDDLIRVSMKNGAAGGKLTGAGGGGCVLIAVPEGLEENIMAILQGKGFSCFLARLGPRGLTCSEKVI